MPNRYYLVDLGTNTNQRQNRLDAIVAKLGAGTVIGGTLQFRTRTFDIVHWCRSRDGRYIIAQAEMSDLDEAWLLGSGWPVTVLGDYDTVALQADPAVWEFKAAAPQDWTPN